MLKDKNYIKSVFFFIPIVLCLNGLSIAQLSLSQSIPDSTNESAVLSETISQPPEAPPQSDPEARMVVLQDPNIIPNESFREDGNTGMTVPSEEILPDEVASTPEPISQAQETGPKLSEEEMMQRVKVSEERISLDLRGIDITELFRILSLKMGITIVPTRSVSGRINIFLNNLTFEDALDVIVISQDLACERKNNIINVMTAAEYERLYGKKYNEKREFSSLKLNYAKPATVFTALSQMKSDIGKVIVDEASGTILMIDIPEKISLMKETAINLDKSPRMEIFDIKYAKASDMKTHLTSAITQGAGEVFVDERSGKVVVSDLPDKMKKIKNMFKAFDAETKEVYIEAEILQITLKKEYQRQINWERLFSDKWAQGLNLRGVFSVSPSFTPSPSLNTASATITMGTFASDKHTETYKYLETLGDAKIISSPRLLVVHGQEAKIMVGSREAYVTTSQSQAETTTVTSESVEFIDVGTKLNITPFINEDGFITMKIKPEVSSVRETLTTALGSEIPIVETTEAETMVKVKDGNTIMIAGLIKQDNRKDTTGVPFLQSIPILGTFFGSRAELNRRIEIIVLITPHIIWGEAAFAGTEAEKVIPADIVPSSLQDKIVNRFVDKEIQKSTTDESSNIAPTQEKAPVAAQPKSSSSAVYDKIKGLKEY